MIACPSIAFDRQIQQRQRRGGISRYFSDLRAGLLAQGVAVLPDDRSSRRRAELVHATFYGGWPYRLQRKQQLVSSLFDMTPERHPEQFFSLGGWRSPHANKARWLSASDLILSISAASADDLQFFLPRIQAPVQVIHLATGMGELQPKPVPGLMERRFWLMVGKRHAYKNGLSVFRALELLRRHSPSNDWPLLVCAGGGSWQASERKQISQHQLSPWVRQLQANDNALAWLYRQAEAVLVPSLAEGFSLPLIEALACDTPVLASDLEVHREVAGRYATLLPALNARAWAEALRDAANQPLARPSEKLGRSGWQQLRRYYALPRLVSDHIAAYSQLKDQRGG